MSNTSLGLHERYFKFWDIVSCPDPQFKPRGGFTLTNGTLQVLLNSQEVTGTYIDDDPYGTATLELVTLKPYCDLNIGELIYSSDQYSAGDAMEIAFDLTNNGSQTIHSATITTVDAAGSNLSSIVLDETIVPGQTITASTYFLIDDAATGHQITITVTPDALKDINTSDNSQSETLVFEDLGVEQCTFGRRADGKVVISADVVNYGYHVRSNISVELHWILWDSILYPLYSFLRTRMCTM